MVIWVIGSINITDRAFYITYGRMFGTFKVEDIKKMYQLLDPQKHYNKAFLEAFTKENDVESDPIKQWRHFPNKHKHESSGMYSVDSLASPYCYANTMICRLFGVSDSARFSIEMVPLMEAAINSYILDWETILSDKTVNQILDYRRNRFLTTRIIPRFYMSAYIMDTIYFNSNYPFYDGNGLVKTQLLFISIISICGKPIIKIIYI